MSLERDKLTTQTTTQHKKSQLLVGNPWELNTRKSLKAGKRNAYEAEQRKSFRLIESIFFSHHPEEKGRVV